jgi:hypothetical protein
MSHVLLMSEVMPLPEPPPVTAIEVPGFRFMKSSAHACDRFTMVSEPLIWTVVLAESLFRLHPDQRTIKRAATETVVRKKRFDIETPFEGDDLVR